MHRLRDALLSPSPRFPAEIGGLDRASSSQQDVRESLARGENLRGAAFYSSTWCISNRYCNVGDGVDALEGYLHSMWHLYYQLGRRTPHQTAEHDRLVLDILRIQGLGPLTRPVSGNYGIDIARTAEGMLWNDLPFLVSDMTDFWINNCASMSGIHRLNFASFLAKLASTRASKDKVCQIGLFILRSTFEDRRELVTPGAPDDEHSNRHLSDLDIAHLLPAACTWINDAGYNIILLSNVLWNDCPSVIGEGGQWFVESELGKRSPTGFSPWRWMYWLKRLHEIQEQAKAANETQLLEHATDAIEHMVEKVKERNSGILRVYQDGGDGLLQDRHLSCLLKKPGD